MQAAITMAFFVVYLATTTLSSEAQPTVTLSHGGKLQGISTTFTDKPVDVFLGVRYAQPPTGDLRFKKPEEAASWEGTTDATEVGNPCPQEVPVASKPDGTKYIGDEDCLFLDISVPGGVTPGAKKPVMVWIHGGAYLMGTGISYIGAGLATHGDVIVVSINYRLGILGFLSVGRGTGNFGLWDQRAALVWVQKNIAAFGGDPDMVTIFGESAGGGSVSAHTIGQHSDGLFTRAITQSGTAFMMFGMSENMQHKLAASFREQTSCNSDVTMYDCFDDMTAEEIVKKIRLTTFMVPTADGDFFSDEEIAEESYKRSHRYDLMSGMNEGEGGSMYAFEVVLFAKSQNYSNPAEFGVSMPFIEKFLEFKCQTQITPLSVNLCVDFLISLYKLDEATDDKDRAVRLAECLGEGLFNADTANKLEQHSSSDKSTYAYYFTELYKPLVPNPMWTLPEWLKKTADHADEVPFIFGAPIFQSELAKNNFWKKSLSADPMIEGFIGSAIPETEAPLSEQMMTMWTNFAKSGNPNKPVETKAPEWPEFNTESNHFLEINSAGCKVIPTPHGVRLTKYRKNLSTARRLQQAADRVPANADLPGDLGSKHDEL